MKKIDLFDIINTIFIVLVTLICFYPLWYVIVISFSDAQGYYASEYHIIPNSFTLDNYKYIFFEKTVPKAFLMSLKVTGLGTAISMILTAFGGYVFSKQHLPGVKFMYKLAVFAMYFSGGMVPMYLLVTRHNIKNTIFALILPTAINTFNVILAKNYFTSLPKEMEESARIDGAGEFRLFTTIIIPLSMPILATLTLFYAVGYWNDYMKVVLYMSDSVKFTLPLVIRRLLLEASSEAASKTGSGASTFKAGMNMATVIVSIVPVLIIYPWLQKYFVGGLMVGAVKG